MDCSCDRCQKLCRSKPGWFSPEQIAPLAASLDLTVEALFRRYLTIDVVLAGHTDVPSPIFVPAPAMVESGDGEVADPRTKGTCVWLQGAKCSIHALKPKECAVVDHTTTPHDSNMLRAVIVKQRQPLTRLAEELHGGKITVPEVLAAEYRRARNRGALRVSPGTMDGLPLPDAGEPG